MQGYYQRASSAPICPVCHGRHVPATRGDGRRVHCDGSPAETHKEQQTRQRVDRERERAADTALDQRRREQRTRTARRARLRAEKKRRADAPPIDAIDQERARAFTGFCPTCDGNTYVGRFGVDAQRCPTCKGAGLV